MTDDSNEIRHVNWSELFGFTHIFKSFKMAIHPSKLLLGVAAIVLIWLAGGAMDKIWCWTDHNAKPGEPKDYIASPTTTAFETTLTQWKENRPRQAGTMLDSILSRGTEFRFVLSNSSDDFGSAFREQINNEKFSSQLPKSGTQSASDYAKDPTKLPSVLSDIRRNLAIQGDVVLQALDEARNTREKAINNIPDSNKAAAVKQLKTDYLNARSNLTQWKTNNKTDLEQIAGEGVFESFTAFEWSNISNAIAAIGNGNFLGGWVPYQSDTAAPAETYRMSPAAAPQQGFVYYFLQAVDGLKWLISQHTLFGIIFLAVALAIWALFGGAIYRIAALHAAREEKISILQALRFSLSKWPSFFTAPLIPLCVVFFLGGLIALGSLVANIPCVGAPLVGILFFLALALGLAIAFVLTGLMTGLGLMYPTIAVEGSDSFDAISRSFAYVYARPWHAGLYAVVTLVYGAACYLFVRFFAFLALTATYMFMRWGVWTGGDALNETDKVPVIWRQPTWESLYGNFRWEAMSGSEHVAAVFIWIWVALVAAGVGAFVLSFVASGGTIIYYLLRRKVDATDLDDVYVQESAELPFDTSAPPSNGDASATEPAEPPPAMETKPDDPGAGSTPEK